MKKASLIITALTAAATAVAIMVLNDPDMEVFSVIIFLYVMISYYSELFICMKLKKAYFKLFPLIYVAVGAVITWVNYDDATLFFPQLSLIFFGIPTLLSFVYIVLGYLISKTGAEKRKSRLRE